jgi:RNA binding exosome subunit
MELANINFRTYCHATEDPSKVTQALGFLIGDDEIDKKFEGKLSNFNIFRTKGYFGNPIVTFTVDIKKSRDIRMFWNSVKLKAPNLVDQLLTEIPDRTDDDCIFHIRFDKQSAYLSKLEFTVHGDCIVVKAKIKAYPAKKELAIKNMEKFLISIRD